MQAYMRAYMHTHAPAARVEVGTGVACRMSPVVNSLSRVCHAARGRTVTCNRTPAYTNYNAVRCNAIQYKAIQYKTEPCPPTRIHGYTHTHTRKYLLQCAFLRIRAYAQTSAHADMQTRRHADMSPIVWLKSSVAYRV
jgi:hypothetical protein